MATGDRPRWQYRIEVVRAASPGNADLESTGRDGWELVSAVGVGELGAVDEIWLFFKRRVTA